MPASLRVSTLACVASLAGLAVAGYGLSRPDQLIERSYAQAFDRLDEARGDVATAGRNGIDASHIHLSRLPAAAPLAPSLAVGDRLTLAQRAGDTAVFEVIDVRPMPSTMLAESGLRHPRLLMVTAVTSGRLPVQTIRFIIEADAPAEATTQAKPHAL